MKTRRRVVAALLLSAAPLGGASAGASHRAFTDAQGYPLVGNLVNKTGPVAPPPDSEVSKELLALRSRLQKLGKAALAQKEEFRPLCNPGDGKALVRDALEAGQSYSVSHFCADLRAGK